MPATLAREAMEESQVRIEDAVYLGFQEVRRPGRSPYAQVRMAGRISGFEPRRPDPHGGRMYRRLLCPPTTSVAAWSRCRARDVLGSW